jgi:hypothetical protein
LLAVRWYLRFGLSYRDLEELLAERGIEVDHVTLYRWVQHFTPLVVDAAGPCRHTAGVRWFGDETYVKVAGVWRYVYWAVDEHARRSTFSCRSAVMSPLPEGSFSGCLRSTKTPRRSPPTGHRRLLQSSLSSSRRLFTTPGSTRTTGLNVTMGDSRLACVRCGA